MNDSIIAIARMRGGEMMRETPSFFQHADGQDIKLLSGQVKLSAAMLANPAGTPDDVLIVAGQVTVTGEVTTVGYRQVIVAGQVAAPAASRDAIEPAVQIQGQVAWYAGGEPRVFYDDVTLSPDFFRLLDHRVGLVVFGDLTIAPGVTETAMLEKVAGITVIAAERAAVVGEAIRHLPEQQRVALAMTAAGGMTSAEVAAALGVPAGTVRYWLSAARRALARALGRYDEPAEES